MSPPTRGLARGRTLDPPPLLATGRTAPYLPDGRAPDLHSTLRQHGAAMLTSEELDDLVEYVLSL